MITFLSLLVIPKYSVENTTVSTDVHATAKKRTMDDSKIIYTAMGKIIAAIVVKDMGKNTFLIYMLHFNPIMLSIRYILTNKMIAFTII